jgi:hypothetical protein
MTASIDTLDQPLDPMAASEDFKKQLKAILDAAEKPFPSFTGDQKRAYDSIHQQLGVEDLRAFVYPPRLPAFLDNARRPAAIPEGAWDPVLQQLRTELAYGQACHQFFRLFDSWLTFVYVNNLSYLNQAVLLAQATSEEEGEFIFKSILNVGLAAMGSLDIKFIGVAVAILQIMIEWAESNGEISSGTVAGTIAKLHTQLEKDFQGCRNSVRALEIRILKRWGSLDPMGVSLLRGTIQWPADEDKMSTVALRSYKVSLWQILLPAVWYIMRPQKDPEYHSSTSWFDGYIKKNPNYYLSATPSGSGYMVSFRWLGRGMFPLGHKQPSAEMCAAIFDTLKIGREDVFLERNGWKGFYRQTLTECSGTHVAALMTAEEHPAGPPEDHLALLRKLRDALKASRMGQWYLGIYDEAAPQILRLYETDPERAIARAIDRYRGPAIYDALVATLRGTGTVSAEQQDDLLAILGAVIDTSVRLLGEDNPVRRRIGETLPRLGRYVGKTYEQVLRQIGQEEPPSTNG